MSNITPTGPKGSPETIANDSAFEVMRGYHAGNYWPSASELVVKHKATGTYWRAIYQERADDNDYSLSATWTEVKPVTVTKYEPVR